MSAIIYLLTNTINGKQYVGQTVYSLKNRWWKHCWSVRNGSNLHLHNAMRKYGPDAFTREILEHTTIEDVNARETYWIAELNTREHGYNMTEGGEGTRGIIRSEEYRAKQRVAKTGKKYSNETRSRMSAAHIGKRFSDESRARMCIAQKGRRKSAEHRAKLSAANMGKKLSPETIAKRTATYKLHRRMKKFMAPPATIVS
jgi:group I intron endonuclease